MTTIDLLECVTCNRLRPVRTRFFARCGLATISGVCNSRLRRRGRRNPRLATIENWVAADTVMDIAVDRFTDSVETELMRLSFPLSFRSYIGDMLRQDIPVALHYHRGDHGGDKPMWLFGVIDPGEIRLAIRDRLWRVPVGNADDVNENSRQNGT